MDIQFAALIIIGVISLSGALLSFLAFLKTGQVVKFNGEFAETISQELDSSVDTALRKLDDRFRKAIKTTEPQETTPEPVGVNKLKVGKPYRRS